MGDRVIVRGTYQYSDLLKPAAPREGSSRQLIGEEENETVSSHGSTPMQICHQSSRTLLHVSAVGLVILVVLGVMHIQNRSSQEHDASAETPAPRAFNPNAWIGRQSQGPQCAPDQYQSGELVLNCNGGGGTELFHLRDEQTTVLASIPAKTDGMNVLLKGHCSFEVKLFDGDSCIFGSGCRYDSAVTKTYAGVSISFSGHDQNMPVESASIEIKGVTTVPLEVRVTAHDTCTSTLTYSHGGISQCPHPTPGCSVCGEYSQCSLGEQPKCDGTSVVSCVEVAHCKSDEYQSGEIVLGCHGAGGTETFQLRDKQTTVIADIPSHADSVSILLKAPCDLDVKLFDGETCVYGYGCKYDSAVTNYYGGVKVTFSGDDRDAPVEESIQITGVTIVPLKIKVKAFDTCMGTLTYSYGAISPCPQPLPGCSECEAYTLCPAGDSPKCDGTSVVSCVEAEGEEYTATPTAVTYVVVAERANERARPSLHAEVVKTWQKGDKVVGIPYTVRGTSWLQLSSGWIIVDGQAYGVGQILEPDLQLQTHETGKETNIEVSSKQLSNTQVSKVEVSSTRIEDIDEDTIERFIAKHDPSSMSDMHLVMPLCAVTDGSAGSLFPCKCGRSSAAKKVCRGAQSCHATNDADGECVGTPSEVSCLGEIARGVKHAKEAKIKAAEKAAKIARSAAEAEARADAKAAADKKASAEYAAAREAKAAVEAKTAAAAEAARERKKEARIKAEEAAEAAADAKIAAEKASKEAKEAVESEAAAELEAEKRAKAAAAERAAALTKAAKLAKAADQAKAAAEANAEAADGAATMFTAAKEVGAALESKIAAEAKAAGFAKAAVVAVAGMESKEGWSSGSAWSYMSGASFGAIDADGQGKLSVKDLSTSFTKLTAKQIEKFVEATDADMDGEIGEDEFAAFKATAASALQYHAIPSGPSATYSVIQDRSNLRQAPSLKSKLLKVYSHGNKVVGTPYDMDDGCRWLQVSSGWMLIDGGCMGLGQLLKHQKALTVEYGSKGSSGEAGSKVQVAAAGSDVLEAAKKSETAWKSFLQKKVLTEPRTCKLWGDPHVESFDHSRFVTYSQGDFWLVKTSEIQIQGRFLVTNWTATYDKTDYSSIHSIVIGGSFVGDVKLEVQSVPGNIICNGIPILAAYGKEMCGDIEVEFSDRGPITDDAVAYLPHKVVTVKLPDRMQVIINRWPSFINLEISMHQATAQDGLCGNFNGLAGDDAGGMIHDRFGSGVTEQECLFSDHIPIRQAVATPNPDKCPYKTADLAATACMQRTTRMTGGKWSLAECIGDLCMAVQEGTMHPWDIKGLYDEGWSSLGMNAVCKMDTHDPTPDGRGTAFVEESLHAEWKHHAAVLIKSGHRCDSGVQDLGQQPSLQTCGEQVKNSGGAFFSYGTGEKAGQCHMASTASAACSEGFEEDAFNFYAVGRDTAVDDCKLLCEAREKCTGIEFTNGRCELWTVPIMTTQARHGFQCLRYLRD